MPYEKFPSIKSLMVLTDGDKEKAKELRAIVDGTARLGNYESVKRLMKDCFHPPTQIHRRFTAANELLGTHGTEAVFDCGAMWPWLEYLNVGDDIETLYRENGKFYVGCISDRVARHK